MVKAGPTSSPRGGAWRGARWRGAAAGLGLALAVTGPGEAQRPGVGPTGARAYDAAQAAASAAATAADETARLLVQLRAQLGPGPHVGARRDLEEEAVATERALHGYRRLAQAGLDEVVRLLVESPRGGEATDRARRQTTEDRALLAGREAEVMAARARTEAERMRALVAEARLLLATDGGARSGPVKPLAAPEPEAGSGVVPNVVGARLEAASRDLGDAGLRLGAVTGPREGFVIRQTPEAGLRLTRGAPVALVLSSTAASTTDPQP